MTASRDWRRLLLQSVHSVIWQRLPRAARRWLLFSVAAKIAPRPGQRPATATGPIYVAGPLRTTSGLGASARLSLRALRSAGYDARGIDLSFEHDPKMQDFEFPESVTAEGAGTIILHVNGFMTPLAMRQLGAKILRDKTVIGYWAWELPELPDEWLAGLNFVHEVWTPSRFVAEAVARRTTIRVRVLAHPVPSPTVSRQPHDVDADLDSRTTVLVAFDMSSSFVRKNPLAAIAAFQKAFGHSLDWRLIVKVNDTDSYPAGRIALEAAIGSSPNITLVQKTLNEAEMTLLQQTADIVLSLHRSEGFGLVLAEAMRDGKVVVATNWSGNTDFMTADNSCPVAYDLVPAIDPQKTYNHPNLVWAEANIGDAASQLSALHDRDLRRRLGAQARTDAERLFSQATYAEKVSEYLSLDPSSMRGNDCRD